MEQHQIVKYIWKEPQKALHSDVLSIFHLVNDSYKLEIGDSGLAFKSNDRYNSPKETEEHIEDFYVMRDKGEIVACARVKEEEEKVYVGPMAVHKDYQGTGLARHLMDFFEGLRPLTEIAVMSCRTDLWPWYKRRGYMEVDSYPAEDFRPRFHLTRKGLRAVVLHKRGKRRLSKL